MFLKFVGLLLCPVLEICSRVHKRAVYVCSNDSTIERHLSLEACELSPEKYCVLDLAKQEYASHLQEGTGLVPSLQVPASYVSADNDQGYKDDWAWGWKI